MRRGGNQPFGSGWHGADERRLLAWMRKLRAEGWKLAGIAAAANAAGHRTRRGGRFTTRMVCEWLARAEQRARPRAPRSEQSTT